MKNNEKIFIGPFNQKITKVSQQYDLKKIFKKGIDASAQEVFENHVIWKDDDVDKQKVCVTGYDIYPHNQMLSSSDLFLSLDMNRSYSNVRLTLRQIVDFCEKYPNHLKVGINLFSFLFYKSFVPESRVFVVRKEKNNELFAISFWAQNLAQYSPGVRLIVREMKAIKRKKVF